MQPGLNANNHNAYSLKMQNAKLSFGSQMQSNMQPVVQQGIPSVQNIQLQGQPLSNDQFSPQNTAIESLNQQISTLQNSQMQDLNLQNQTQSSNVQNNPTTSAGGGKKLLFGAIVVAAGAGIIALVCKIKGKNSDKAVKKAADTISIATNKTEGEAQEAVSAAETKKTGILQKAKEKVKSFFDEAKKGYKEYTPKPESEKPGFFDDVKKGYDDYVPSDTSVKKKHKPKTDAPDTGKPKGAKAIMREKILGILTEFENVTASIFKITNEANEFTKAGVNVSTVALQNIDNKGKIETWVQKVINDYSSAADSSVKRSGIGKVNAFCRVDTETWIYNEGYSKSLKTARVKKHIAVTPDEIKIKFDNVKNGKKNIETIGRSFEYNKANGMIRQYSDRKITPNGVQYSKSMEFARGSTVPDIYTEGYKELSDGTVKIARQVKNGTDATYGMCYEDIIKHTDGKETYGKMLSYDSSGADFYWEGYTKHIDGSSEALIDFDIRGGLYYEMSKINVDGSEEAAKKIKFLHDKKPAYQMEGYRKSASGEIAADTRIEFTVGTGQPKYYYENYKYSPASSKESYTLKAEFRDGKWYRVN